MAIKTRQSMTADYQKNKGKLKKVIGVISSFLIVAAVILTVLYWVSNIGSAIANRREVAEIERSVQTEQRQQTIAAARAQTVAAHEQMEGVWRIIGGVDSPVYVSNYSITSSGELKSFEFQYSFVGASDGRPYSNTWSCSATRTNQFECTWRQRWEGGSQRGEAFLTKSGDMFSGRFLYQNQWEEITFKKAL